MNNFIMNMTLTKRSQIYCDKPTNRLNEVLHKAYWKDPVSQIRILALLNYDLLIVISHPLTNCTSPIVIAVKNHLARHHRLVSYKWQQQRLSHYISKSAEFQSTREWRHRHSLPLFGRAQCAKQGNPKMAPFPLYLSNIVTRCKITNNIFRWLMEERLSYE